MRMASMVTTLALTYLYSGCSAEADRIAPIDIVPSEWLERNRHKNSDDSQSILREIEDLTIKANKSARSASCSKLRTIKQRYFQESLKSFKAGQHAYIELKQRFRITYDEHLEDHKEFVDAYLAILKTVGSTNSLTAKTLRSILSELERQISKRGPRARSYANGWTDRDDMLYQIHRRSK